MLKRGTLWCALTVLFLNLIGTQTRCPEGTYCTKVDECLTRGRETLIQRCRNGICCLLPKAGETTTHRSETVTDKSTTIAPPTTNVPSLPASPVQSFRPIPPASPFGQYFGLPTHPFGGVIPWHVFNPGHVSPHRPYFSAKSKSQSSETMEDKRSQARQQEEIDSLNSALQSTGDTLDLNNQQVHARSRQKRNIAPLAPMHYGPSFSPMLFSRLTPGLYSPLVTWAPPIHYNFLPNPVPQVSPMPIMQHAPMLPPFLVPQAPPISVAPRFPAIPPAPLPPLPTSPIHPPQRIIIREGRPLLINMIQYKGIDFRHLDRMCQARGADDAVCRNF